MDMHTIYEKQVKSFVQLDADIPSCELEVRRAKGYRLTLAVNDVGDPHVQKLLDLQPDIGPDLFTLRLPAHTPETVRTETVTRGWFRRRRVTSSTTTTTGSNLRIKVTVYCPDLELLRLSVASGHAVVGVEVGEARINIASGTTRLGSVGILDAAVASGVLSVSAIDGPLQLTSGSGTMRFMNYRGSNAYVSVASGNLKIEDASKASGPMDLKVASGTIRIPGAAANRALTITERKASGSIDLR